MSTVTGIDIQPIDEVAESLARFGDRYLRRIYGELELEECQTNDVHLARDLALRFAAKEAVLKVLRPHDHIPSWRLIEVLLRHREGPRVVLIGEAEQLARHNGVERMFLSVSRGRDYAIATVVADVTMK